MSSEFLLLITAWVIAQIFGIAMKWPGAVVTAVSRWRNPWKSERLKYLRCSRIAEKSIGERNKEQKLVFKGIMLDQSLSNVTYILIHHHSCGWKGKKCSICFECSGFTFESQAFKVNVSFYLLGFLCVFLFSESDKLYCFCFNNISGRCLLMCFLYSAYRQTFFCGFVDNSGSCVPGRLKDWPEKASVRGDLDVSVNK